MFGIFWDIYAPKYVCVKDIGSRASMVLQNSQKLIEITSNMIYIVALGVGLKCPCKIHLNTQCPCSTVNCTDWTQQEAGVFKLGNN